MEEKLKPIFIISQGSFMKTFFVVSVPEGYEERFANLIRNGNAVSDRLNPIKIEGVYRTKPEIVAIPKEKNENRNKHSED
jgi:hypothetical protein